MQVLMSSMSSVSVNTSSMQLDHLKTWLPFLLSVSMSLSKIDVLSDDRGLLACLEGANLHKAWIEEFTKIHKISTLDDFVYLVTASDWEKSLSELISITSYKTDRIAGARFKSAYLAGSQALKQSLQVQQVADDPDQPLPESTTQQLNRDWDKKYGIRWEAFVDPADSLRARVYREFKKFTMTLVECRKVKSILTHSLPKAHEEVLLQGDVKIAFAKEQVTEIKSVIDYYFALRTLAVAWSWAGNWPTRDKHNKEVLMMDLSTAMGYADRALADCATYGRNSLSWLSRNDMLTRGTMASLMRQQWPAGEALKEALRQHHVDWKTPSMQGVVQEPETKRKPAAELPSGVSQPDMKRSRQLKADGLATISMVKGGHRLCKAFNDSRGCRQKNCTFLHQCDVKLPSGKGCLSKTHNRLQHSDSMEWLEAPLEGGDSSSGRNRPEWETPHCVYSVQSPVEAPRTSARQVMMDGSAPTTPSEVGKSLAAAKPVSWHGKGDVLQAPWVPTLRGKWLVIDLWSGIGGLCLALLSLGVTFWALSAECDEEAVQVAKANFPNAVHIHAVEAIDESTLQPFFQRRDVRGVLIGGGSPCQGNSELNNGRQGLLDDRSWQPTEIRRLKALVEKLAPAAEVLCLLENVASMPPEVLKQYNWVVRFSSRQSVC